MYNYQLLHDGKEVAVFENQENDFKVLEALQRKQSQSSFWAIAYEGWVILMEDLETGKKYKSKANANTFNTWDFVEFN